MIHNFLLYPITLFFTHTHIFQKKSRHIVINMPFEELVHFDGCCFPPFPPLAKDAKKHLEALRNMKTRDDDVIMITFPKCGMESVFFLMIFIKYYRYSLSVIDIDILFAD